MTYDDFIALWHDDSDCIVCHTSGSTGTPKPIALPKAQMAESARRTILFFDLDSASHLHSCISPDYIGGKMMAVRAELLGASLTCETPSNRPLSGYRGADIDLLAVVPSQMLYILDCIEAGEKLPRIRHIIIGGAPISDSLRLRIASSGLSAWETYGMTETASHIALRKVSAQEEPFRPLDGISVSCSEQGTLAIKVDGWQEIVTNDIADVAADGSFRILGRIDNVIVTGGKKVHPEWVESLMEHALGCEVLICPEPDEKWGQRVVMIVENCDLTDEQILEIFRHSICEHELGKEYVPKKIIRGAIQRTPNGKKCRKRTM